MARRKIPPHQRQHPDQQAAQRFEDRMRRGKNDFETAWTDPQRTDVPARLADWVSASQYRGPNEKLKQRLGKALPYRQICRMTAALAFISAALPRGEGVASILSDQIERIAKERFGLRLKPQI